jgi:hypothetical protein
LARLPRDLARSRRNYSAYAQLRRKTIAQNAIKITRIQSKLYAIRSERLNLRFSRIQIFV